jgi:hypothetical protein
MNIKGFFVNNKVEIFTGLGIGAVITGVIAACKSSMKINTVIEEHNAIREAIDKEEDPKVKRSETFKLYGYTAARFTGLFAAPAALIAGGIGLMTHATKLSMDENVKLAEKNMALAAAASANESRFDKYRDRVVDKYGKEVDEELMNPSKEISVETEETDPETGKKKKVKEKIKVFNPDNDLNDCRIYITRSNPNWQEDPTMMKFTIDCIYDEVNEMLDKKRHDGRKTWLTVNDIRERFGIDPKRDLQFKGWIKDNYDVNDNTKILFKYKEDGPSYIPGADGELEPVWIIDLNAQPIYEEIL